MNTKLRGVSELGLFIGRDRTRPFLNIDGDFFNAKHLNGEGRLVAIDVWGVGGKASAEEQDNMRQWEGKQIEKSRKVNPRICLLFFLDYYLIFCIGQEILRRRRSDSQHGWRRNTSYTRTILMNSRENKISLLFICICLIKLDKHCFWESVEDPICILFSSSFR